MTAAVTVCRHGRDVRGCYICRPDLATEPERVVASLDALFPSVCPVCSKQIEAGTRINRTNRFRYLHEECQP